MSSTAQTQSKSQSQSLSQSQAINTDCHTISKVENAAELSETICKTVVVPCPNFDDPLDLSLMTAEMDIDLKTSKSLSGKQYILAIPITQFFRNVRNMYALINILNGQSIISLRLIEYFVVNYVLENNTFFDINRYNKCPEFLIRNLREKVYSIPEPLVVGVPQHNQQTIDKHTSPVVNIEAQKLAYRKARDEIIADIQSKNQAAAATNTTQSGRTRQTGTAKPAKKQPITLETFFSQRAITDYTAAQKLQQQQQNQLAGANLTPKNFDNYIIVHDNYKCQLKEYNKKNFDPFCRWNRIRLYYDKNKFFYTTIAQLNFFKWAIEKHILDYVIENLETIEKSMNEYEKSVKAEKQLRKARQLLEKASGAMVAESTNPSEEVLNNAQPEQGHVAQEQYNSDGQITDTEPPQAIASPNGLLPISLLSTRKTVKKNIVLGNSESKSVVRNRRKKEFTKTNRSILLFNAYKIVSFD
jgi:hypothetical protein